MALHECFWSLLIVFRYLMNAWKMQRGLHQGRREKLGYSEDTSEYWYFWKTSRHFKKVAVSFFFFFWQCNTTLFYLLQSLNQKQALKNNNNDRKETNKQKNNYHVFLLRTWMSQLKFPNALFHVIFIIYLVWVVPRHTGKGNYWTHWNCNFTVISACSQGHALKDNRESWA